MSSKIINIKIKIEVKDIVVSLNLPEISVKVNCAQRHQHSYIQSEAFIPSIYIAIVSIELEIKKKKSQDYKIASR